jgi:hypothetical protein
MAEEVKSIKQKTKERIKKFNRELKKEMNTAILAAFGFLIALVWKDVITNFVNTISKRSPVQGALFSALIVTFICVIGIMIISRFLSVKDEEPKPDKLILTA